MTVELFWLKGNATTAGNQSSYVWHIFTNVEQALRINSLRLYSSSPARAEFTLCTATWLQAPGAAPQSITLCPGFKTRNLSSIWSNLKALLHRKLSVRAAFTYGSLNCRCNQRCSAALLPFGVFIKHDEEWRHLAWMYRRNIAVDYPGLAPLCTNIRSCVYFGRARLTPLRGKDDSSLVEENHCVSHLKCSPCQQNWGQSVPIRTYSRS